jgi:hypothetical protein
MFLGLAVFVAISTLVAMSLVRENPAEVPKESLGYFYKLFYRFFLNKNLRIFLIFSFISRGLKAYWPCVTPLALLDLGFNKETLSYLGAIGMFLGFISSLLFSKFKFDKPLDLFLKTYRIQVISYAIQTSIFYLKKSFNSKGLSLTLQILVQLIDTASNLNFTTYSVFMNTISDPNCNGMYLSFLNAFSNIPSLVFNPFFSRLLTNGALKPSLAMLTSVVIFSWTLLPVLVNKLKSLKPRDFHLTQLKSE